MTLIGASIAILRKSLQIQSQSVLHETIIPLLDKLLDNSFVVRCWENMICFKCELPTYDFHNFNCVQLFEQLISVVQKVSYLIKVRTLI